MKIRLSPKSKVQSPKSEGQASAFYNTLTRKLIFIRGGTNPVVMAIYIGHSTSLSFGLRSRCKRDHSVVILWSFGFAVISFPRSEFRVQVVVIGLKLSTAYCLLDFGPWTLDVRLRTNAPPSTPSESVCLISLNQKSHPFRVR